MFTQLSDVNLTKYGHQMGHFDAFKDGIPKNFILVPGAMFRGNTVFMVSSLLPIDYEQPKR